MKLAMIFSGTDKTAGIVTPDGLALIETINKTENKQWSKSLHAIISRQELQEIAGWYDNGGKKKLGIMAKIPLDQCRFAPPVQSPKNIWGIGLNYIADRSETAKPRSAHPVTFLKPSAALTGPGENIEIPAQSTRTTGEAELVIVIGKICKNVEVEDVPGYIAGLTTGLDMTEADIHAENPRYLARAKSFDTFCSIGPVVRTLNGEDDILDLDISTVLNGDIIHSSITSNMIYKPWEIVSYLSKSTTLLPGDVILTGTPGPVDIQHGDTLECRISGFESLTNPVVRAGAG